MTSNRFFIEPKNPVSTRIILEGEEHYHLSRVSRIQVNEKVQLFDGKGRSYTARVERIEKEKTELVILEAREKAGAKIKITLAQALVKSKKMEFILQKAVELGVYTFIPIITSRSMIHVKEKANLKLERWKKIAREAAKQSGNAWIPDISPPLTLENLVSRRKAERRFLLSENRGKYLREILLEYEREKNEDFPRSIVILVGPEGGWKREEEEYILEHNFEAVSLGENTLRTETASLCSLALISHFWNL